MEGDAKSNHNTSHIIFHYPVSMNQHTIVFLLVLTIPLWLLRNQLYWIGGICTLFALFIGWLDPLGILWIALYATLLWQYKIQQQDLPWVVIPVVIASTALIGHLLPGFNSPIVISSIQVTVDAVPYTKYLSIDKLAVGILIVGLLTKKPQLKSWPRILIAGFLCGVTAAVLVLGFTTLSGLIRFEPKWADFMFTWLLTNLLITCLAEEGVFRRLIQEEFSRWSVRQGHSRWWGVPPAAILFGAVHFTGGPGYMIAAGFAGCAYGAAYEYTGRIEAAMMAHLLLNLLHLLLFTYPYLA